MSQGVPSLADAAQVVTGVIAARGRGDVAGARDLLASIDRDELLGGSLLVAALALGLLCRATGETLDECAGDLSLQIAGLSRP